MSHTEKLQIIISTLCNNNQSEFARRLGINQSTVAAWLRRDSIDYDLVIEKLPELSAEWLMRGHGSMLLSDNHPTIITNTVHGDGDAVSGTKITTDTALHDLQQTLIAMQQQLDTVTTEKDEILKQIQDLRNQNFALTNKLLALL